MREIVLDTETTGIDCAKGDRLIEIGCVELYNRIPTGRELHFYVNPEGRQVHPDAERVHGISFASLQDKPRFKDIAEAFLTFIGDDPLVAHNAQFDVAFLNAELERLSLPRIAMDRVVDTLALARRKHPAGPNSLDALCKRYGIDNSKRTKHGALMDSLLLAGVYVELLGERQTALVLDVAAQAVLAEAQVGGRVKGAAQRPRPLNPRLTSDDEARHAAFVETLGESAIWRRYLVLAG